MRTSNPETTRELAGAIAPLLGSGDMLVLAGDLGAGKTTFTKGLATALGVTGTVTSPTFTLMHEYAAPVPVVHIDLYRLEHLQEVHDLGFDELVGGDAIVVVEWGDILGPLLPPDRLDITFEYGPDPASAAETERIVSVIPHGAAWTGRARGLAAALEPFGGS